ncbi:MAG TPA: sigma-70 family RNA polymerase sigma factor [Thermoanaerobaculia bacterium]|nr:sigma-70 family RNA polymerase sigma factor [Thermoanaerobaculia bacterium]
MTALPVMMDEPEDLLDSIRAARSGDSRAFETIMRATERRVASLAWRLLGDAEDVKEALQETFLRVYRFLGKYDEQRDFFGWLYRITVNVCRDLESRRRFWRFFLPIQHACDVEAPQEDFARKDDVARLRRAIETLPQKERFAIILRDLEELPTERVAEILGSSPATVRVQISKARIKIRKFMESGR